MEFIFLWLEKEYNEENDVVYQKIVSIIEKN